MQMCWRNFHKEVRFMALKFGWTKGTKLQQTAASCTLQHVCGLLLTRELAIVRTIYQPTNQPKNQPTNQPTNQRFKMSMQPITNQTI